MVGLEQEVEQVLERVLEQVLEQVLERVLVLVLVWVLVWSTRGLCLCLLRHPSSRAGTLRTSPSPATAGGPATTAHPAQWWTARLPSATSPLVPP